MYGHIVLADTKSGFIPGAIKWFTKSTFSHSLVTMPDCLGVPMCIEAAEGGVDFTRYDSGYENNDGVGIQVWNIKIDQSIKEAAAKSVLNDLEIMYGFLQYAWFIGRFLLARLGVDIKARKNPIGQGMVCSQLCVAYLKACGLEHVLVGYGDGSIVPQDLQNIFLAHPELFEIVEQKRL